MFYQTLKSRDHISFYIDELSKPDFILIPELICREYEETIKNKMICTIKYKVDENLQINIDDLKEKIKQSKSNNLFIILTDYFGITNLEKAIKLLKGECQNIYIDAAMSIKAVKIALKNKLPYSCSIYKHLGINKGIYASYLGNYKAHRSKKLIYTLLIWFLKLIALPIRRLRINLSNLKIIFNLRKDLIKQISIFKKDLKFCKINFIHRMILIVEFLIRKLLIETVKEEIILQEYNKINSVYKFGHNEVWSIYHS